MSTDTDNRVVVLKFDNQQFERAIKESSKSLDNFKKSLKFDNLAGGVKNIERAIASVSFSHMERALDNISNKFNLVGMIGMNAMHRISDAALNAGENVVKLVTGVEGVVDGFREYETQMGAVQTIMSNTASKGTTLEQVNAALDKLNTYADQTIYNFTEMTRNIGTFTAAGVDLDTSTAAIKGIANLAAMSGSTSQQASTAMYQLSQALASGTVKLMDWNSVVNAGMGGQVFQDALKETARVHGIAIDEMIANEGSFRESLSKGWLSQEVLLETLKKFTGDLTDEELRNIGYTEEQIIAIKHLGEEAEKDATKVKTFTQLIDTLKEAAGSGWSQTFKILIGDFYEARDLWSSISNVLEGLINTASQNRNNLLEDAFGKKRDQAITLDRWKEFADTGLASDAFIESLKYNARSAGVEIDDLIAQYGSFEASLEAGWLTKDMFQSAVDWNARSTEMHFEWSKGLVQQIADGALGSEEEARAVVEAMGYDYDLYRELANKYMDPETYGELDWDAIWNDEAMLDALGVRRTTEEFQAMHDAIEDADSAFSQFLAKDDGTSGREVLLEGLGIIGQQLIDIFTLIGEAWNEAFPPATGDDIFNIVQGFRDFVDGAKMTEDQAGQLKNIFKGLFDAVGIVADVLGAVFDGVARALSLDDSETKPLQFLLDFLETLATKISAFRNFLKTENKLSKATGILTWVFNTFFTLFGGIVGLFSSLTKGEALDFSFLDSLGATFSNFGDIIKSASFKPFADMISGIKETFSQHGVDLDWLDPVIEKLESLTVGSLIGGIKKFLNIGDESPFDAVKNMIFGEDGLNFKMPSFDMFTVLGNGLNKLHDLYTKAKNWFSNIDFSSISWENIKQWFSGLVETISTKLGEVDTSSVSGFISSISDKFNLSEVIGDVKSKFNELDFGFVGEWFEKAKTWFEGLEINFSPIDTIIDKLESLVDWVKQFFGGNSDAGAEALKDAPAKALRGMANSNQQLSRNVVWLTGNGAPAEVHEGIDSVFSFIDDLKAKIEDFTNSDGFKSFVEFISGAKDLLPILLGAYGILRIKSFFTGLGDAVEEFAGRFTGQQKETYAETFLKVAGGVDLICDAIRRIAPYTKDMDALGEGLATVLKAFGTIVGGTTLASILGNRFGGITSGVGFVMMGVAIEIIVDALVKILEIMKDKNITQEQIDHAVILIGALEGVTGLFTGLGELLAGLGGVGGFASFGVGFSFLALSSAVSNLITSVADVITLFNESGLEPTSTSETLGWLGQFATDFRTNAKEVLDTADTTGGYDEGKVYRAAGVVGALEMFTGVSVGLAGKILFAKNNGLFAGFGTAVSFAALGATIDDLLHGVDTVIQWKKQGISEEDITYAGLVVGALEGFTATTVTIASALNGLTTPSVEKNVSKSGKTISKVGGFFSSAGNMFSGFGIYAAASGMTEIAEAVLMLSGVKYEDLESGAKVIAECFGGIITGEVVATIALTAMNLKSVETALMALGAAFAMISWGMNLYTDTITDVKNLLDSGELTKEDFSEYGSLVMSGFAEGLADPNMIESIKAIIGGVFDSLQNVLFSLFINMYNLLASLLGPVIEGLFGEAPKLVSSYTMDENGLITIFMSSNEDNLNYESLGTSLVDLDAIDEAHEEAVAEAQAEAQEALDEQQTEVPVEDQIRFLYNIATTPTDEQGVFRSAEARAEAMAQAQELYEKDIYDRVFGDTVDSLYKGERNILADVSNYSPFYEYGDLTQLNENVDVNGIARQAVHDAEAVVDQYGQQYGEYITAAEEQMRSDLLNLVEGTFSARPDLSSEFIQGIGQYLQDYANAYVINEEDPFIYLADFYTEEQIADYESLRNAFDTIFSNPNYADIVDAAKTDALNDALAVYNAKTTEQSLRLDGIQYLVKDAGDVSVVWDTNTGRQVIYDAEKQAYRVLGEGELFDESKGMVGEINVEDFISVTGADALAVKTYQEYLEYLDEIFLRTNDSEGKSEPLYTPLDEAVKNGISDIGQYLHPSQYDYMVDLYGDPEQAIAYYTKKFSWQNVRKFIQTPAFARNAEIGSFFSPIVDGFATGAKEAERIASGFSDWISSLWSFGETNPNIISDPYWFNPADILTPAVASAEEAISEEEPTEIEIPVKPKFIYEVTSGSKEDNTLWGNIFDTESLTTYWDQLISGTDFETQGMQFDPTAGIDFQQFVARATTEGENFVNGYVTAISKGQDAAAGAAGSVAQRAIDEVPIVQQSHSPSHITQGYGHDFGEGYRLGITECISVVAQAASDLANAAVRAFENLKQKFYNVGLDSMMGFANGISAGSSRAIDAAVATATRALDASKAALEVGSPSKKFEEVGLFSDQGLALGFLRNAYLVENASTKVGNSALDRMKSAIKTVNDAMESDLPTGPTIRPVMDLSEFQNQNSRLHKTLNSYGDQLYGKLSGIDESTMGNSRNITQVYIDGARVNDVPEMEETFRDMLVYYKRLGLMNNGRRTRY